MSQGISEAVESLYNFSESVVDVVFDGESEGLAASQGTSRVSAENAQVAARAIIDEHKFVDLVTSGAFEQLSPVIREAIIDKVISAH